MFVYKLLIEKKNCTVKSLMDPPSFTLLGAYIPEWPNMRRLQMFGQLSRVKRWVYGSTHVHHVVQLNCILMLCIYIWKLTNEDTKKLKAKQGSEKKSQYILSNSWYGDTPRLKRKTLGYTVYMYAYKYHVMHKLCKTMFLTKNLLSECNPLHRVWAKGIALILIFLNLI